MIITFEKIATARQSAGAHGSSGGHVPMGSAQIIKLADATPPCVVHRPNLAGFTPRPFPSYGELYPVQPREPRSNFSQFLIDLVASIFFAAFATVTAGAMMASGFFLFFCKF